MTIKPVPIKILKIAFAHPFLCHKCMKFFYIIVFDNIKLVKYIFDNNVMKCWHIICTLITSRPTNNLKIPMILLQGLDVLNLYEQTSCFERNSNCEIGISSSNQTLPSEIVTKVNRRSLKQYSHHYFLPYNEVRLRIHFILIFSTNVLDEMMQMSGTEYAMVIRQIRAYSRLTISSMNIQTVSTVNQFFKSHY